MLIFPTNGLFRLSYQYKPPSDEPKDPLYQIPSSNARANPPTHTDPLDPHARKPQAPGQQAPSNGRPKTGTNQTMSVMGGLLGSEEMAQAPPGSNKRMNTAAMQVNPDLLGGVPPDGDPYVTTTQLLNQGKSTNEAKHASAKKMIGTGFEPELMISPITGERVADYGDWAEQLKKKRSMANQPQVEDEPEEDNHDPLMSKLKKTMNKRGAKGIIGLARLFKIMDDDGSNSLSFAEFKKAMKELAMDLSDVELIMLFKRFDQAGTGAIQYNDFLKTITGALNKRRRKLVNMAYDVLDRDGSGQVDIADIAMAYDVSKHPEFISGKRSKDDILREFLDGFDVGGTKDGLVTREEFENYYTTMSAAIDSDDYFELMIRNAWHISGGEGAAANSSNRRVLVTNADGTQSVVEIKDDLGLKPDDKEGMLARLKKQGINATSIATNGGGEDNNKKFGARPGTGKGGGGGGGRGGSPTKRGGGQAKGGGGGTPPHPGIQMMIDKIKKEMKSRGSGGFIGLQRRFKIMDDDGSKSLNLSEFKKALKEFKMDLTEADLRALFEHFDQDQSGSIDFEEFVQGVRDPMTENRQKLVKMAFRILDTDDSGIIDAQEISSKYDASKHPEVIAKRKTPAAVLREFLDTFDVGGEKDGMVTQQEFLNYYANISASIDNEDYFELMIRNAWHISGGEGQAANSSNMRVEVTDATGVEQVVTLTTDLGIKGRDDYNGIYKQLKSQGIKDINSINGKVIKLQNVNGVMIAVSTGKAPNAQIGDSSSGTLAAAAASKGPTVRGAPTRPGHQQRAGGPQSLLQMEGKSNVSAGGGYDPQLDRNSAPAPSSLAATGVRGNLASRMVLSQMKQADKAKKQEQAEKIVCKTLLDVMRAQLLARGTSGIIDLQRKFIDMDIDGSKSLDIDEFRAAMKKDNMTFTDQQLHSLFHYFDTDGSQTIDYTELLNGLRGQLVPKLLVLVHQAFDILDTGRENEIEPKELLNGFNANAHPDVLMRKRTAEEVMTEFMDTVDIGTEKPGKITRDEFVNYYTNIAASINDDDYLEIIIRKVWGLGDGNSVSSAMMPPPAAARRLQDAQRFGNTMPAPAPSFSGSSSSSGRRPSSASATGGYGRPPQQPNYSNNNNNNNQVPSLQMDHNNNNKRPSSAGSSRGILSARRDSGRGGAGGGGNNSTANSRLYNSQRPNGGRPSFSAYSDDSGSIDSNQPSEFCVIIYTRFL